MASLEFCFHVDVDVSAALQRPGTSGRPRRRLNIGVGRFDLPIGMALIFLTLAIAAIANILTKEVATITGVAFTVAFYAVFWISEHAHRRRMGALASQHEHLEQFNEEQSDQLSVESLHLTKPYRKLVAIRSPYSWEFMLFFFRGLPSG